MKKSIALLMIAILSIGCFAQSSSSIPPRYEINPNARYQLFPTENRWIFIKLDTQTGKMWMVQYSTESPAKMFTVSLNDLSLSPDETKSNPGRFTLYPTQNWYNFLLLDQVDGRIWQVQWSTDPDNTGLWRIY